VAYIDQARAFDPDYAQRCGLDLARLLVGWPLDGGETLAMAEALVASGGLAALAFDALGLLWRDPTMARRLAACLKRLTAPLARSGTLLLFLHGPDALDATTRSALAHHAAVRLQVTRERWLRRQGDIPGLHRPRGGAQEPAGTGRTRRAGQHRVRQHTRRGRLVSRGDHVHPVL
jgi:RecA/RadA recombinase